MVKETWDKLSDQQKLERLRRELQEVSVVLTRLEQRFSKPSTARALVGGANRMSPDRYLLPL